jgi:hypothetical protein
MPFEGETWPAELDTKALDCLPPSLHCLHLCLLREAAAGKTENQLRADVGPMLLCADDGEGTHLALEVAACRVAPGQH